MHPDSDDAVGGARHATVPGDTPGSTERRPDQPASERSPDASPQPAVAVTVIRSGGFAGLRRTWRAEAGEDEAPHWVTLIEGCPWDAVRIGTGPAGADLFMWRLDVRCGDRRRAAELADPEVRGPWRDLIDAVREAGSPGRRSGD
ncbi:protealysin inhibitor emfourin [Microbacterium pumilum]|uniref:Uncharacterized protein n=1 Tax=Microbacterium pumilum TaxID=344165 RepID=A0ABP5DWG3_9MICO